MSTPIDLSTYKNTWYSPGRSVVWRALWLFIAQPLFRSTMLPFSGLRCSLLRVFGCTVGKGVVIHSEVVIKYPWYLSIGDNTWIGERVWIDCLTTVCIANNVCISQGAYLCTGNHDWSDPSFGLRVDSIQVMDGAWIGAQSTVLPGSKLERGAVVTAGSVLSGTIPAFEIYGGNPATYLRARNVRGIRLRVAESAESMEAGAS